jgi:hypothetical protein
VFVSTHKIISLEFLRKFYAFIPKLPKGSTGTPFSVQYNLYRDAIEYVNCLICLYGELLHNGSRNDFYNFNFICYSIECNKLKSGYSGALSMGKLTPHDFFGVSKFLERYGCLLLYS